MSNGEFGGEFIARFIPILAFLVIMLSRSARRNQNSKTRSKTGTAKNVPNLRGGSSVPTMTTTTTPAARTSSATVTMPAGTTSVGPKPWQVGKHNVTKKNTYKSAFEKKGLSSGGTVSAFGDSRDVISSESMAASNAAYMDVGNDYMSSFEVGGHRETPIGFDR